MAKKDKKKSAIKGLRYLRLLSLIVVMALAKPMIRFTALAILFVVLLWLLYANVWQQLIREVPLPAGVTHDAPQLDVDLIKSIDEQREQRTDRSRESFNNLNDKFYVPINL